MAVIWLLVFFFPVLFSLYIYFCHLNLIVKLLIYFSHVSSLLLAVSFLFLCHMLPLLSPSK